MRATVMYGAGDGVARVGVPYHEAIPLAQPTFYNNVTISGGPAPVRAYIEELLPDVLGGAQGYGRALKWNRVEE